MTASLDFAAAGLVLFSALLHASWNALVKKSGSQYQSMVLTTSTTFLAAACMVPLLPLPARECWPFLALSALTHLGYRSFLVLAYRAGDLNQVYPLARGTGPLLVTLASTLLLGEIPPILELAGVLLICGGIIGLARGRTIDRSALLYALATGAMIAGYTLLDGLGVRRSGGALSYSLWLFFWEGMPWMLAALVHLRGTGKLRVTLADCGNGLAAGLLSMLAYCLVVWAMSVGALASVAALRETGVIFAALIGHYFLGEPFGRKRMALATLVAAGAVFISGF